jgi:raffinose/stachyose/melibiose transport system substrate-binding protein
VKLVGCLAALAAFGAVVAGCGGGGGGSSDSGTLTISAWDTGAPNDPLDKAVADFEKANSKVKVEVKKTAFPQYAQALRQQLSTNQAPDLARAVLGYSEASSATTLAEKGLLATIGGSWIEEVPGGAKVATEDENGTFAYPVDSAAIGVFYEPAALKAAGLTIPKSFSEVISACETGASGKIVFALGANETSGMPLFIADALTASTVYAEDPQFGEKRVNEEATFSESKGWQQTLERFTEMKEAGCFDKDAVGISQEEASLELGQGKALMAVSLTVTLPLFQAGNPKGELKMAPFPGSDDAASNQVTAGPVDGLVIPKKGGNPELAEKFIDFYAEHRGEYSKIDETIPTIPVSEGERSVPSYAAELEPLLNEGKAAPIPQNEWPSPEVQTALAQGLVEILLGSAEPKGVLEKMDSVWTAPGSE